MLLAAAILAAAACAGCDGAAAARAIPTPPGAPSRPPSGESASAGKSAIETTFDDVKLALKKNEDFQESYLTPRVKALFGQHIRIRGYMYPTLRKRGLTQFVLVRDNQECCFGPGAALHDCILVTMTAGKTAEFSIRPVAVEGTFRFDERTGPDGRVLAIYQMAGDAVN